MHQGGAETALCNLLARMPKFRFYNKVICLREEGVISEKIRRLGHEVACLNYAPGIPNPKMIYDTLRVIRDFSPDLIKTWMYHANIVGGLAGALEGNTPIIWGIRHGPLNSNTSKKATKIVVKVCASLSGSIPEKIVFNSQSSLKYHKRIGYSPEKLLCIPNGVDPDIFKPQPELRTLVRRQLGIVKDDLVIGTVTRNHPDKDVSLFLETASKLFQRNRHVKFILCGQGVNRESFNSVPFLSNRAFESSCYFLGPRADIPAVLNAMDLFSLTSASESFPNVILEAMATGLSCVATDVGDCATIIGETGSVTPPKDSIALAQAWEQFVNLSGSAKIVLANQTRQRVMDRYISNIMASRFVELFETFL